eukprot:gb/GFBE01044708.1/.p1 GENE.gb/GFBE01044708.1/~~gb/GFBE01044708.1/.p1  ORF type:complete len:312 (+),score=59.24 gb/GFBE01044708.1/:1-936(+)
MRRRWRSASMLAAIAAAAISRRSTCTAWGRCPHQLRSVRGVALAALSELSRPQPTASGKPVVLDRLCHEWSIYQVADGYRFNGDDILLARAAWHSVPHGRHLLDLGAGTGSVGLLWLAQQPPEAMLTSLEAQEESVELFRRSIDRLGLQQRVCSKQGDLRDSDVISQLDPTFDIITANPPYLDPKGRQLPAHLQRRYCYYELRGGIAEFAAAAAAKLSPTGKFCMVRVHDRGDDMLAAVRRAGLVAEKRLTAFARGRPKWQVLVCSKSSRDEELEEQTLIVRDQRGVWTSDWDDICHEMGAFQKPQMEANQ